MIDPVPGDVGPWGPWGIKINVSQAPFIEGRKPESACTNVWYLSPCWGMPRGYSLHPHPLTPTHKCGDVN